MSSEKKMVGSSSKDVNEMYNRAFSCLHVVDQYGDKEERKLEMHRVSLVFSRMFGHLYKTGFLDAKTLQKFLIDMRANC